MRSPSTTMPQSQERSISATSAPMLSADGKRFTFIDALRGLAALGVAAYHIDRANYGPLPGAASPIIPAALNTVLHHGWMGVQIFFVISGFVIAYALRGARITPTYYRNFAIARSLRLDPPYWFTIFFVIALHALTNSLFSIGSPLMDDFPSAARFVSHFFYLQNVLGFDNISVGFWTLCIEMQFYLLFALLLGLAQSLAARLIERRGVRPETADRWSLAALFAPVALASLFSFSLNPDNTIWVIHYFAFFALGAVTWWTLEGRIPKAAFWAYFAAIVLRQTLHWTDDMAVALIAGTAIYTVGRLGHLHDWLSAGWLQRLGRISYSLYLIHYPVSWIVTTVGYQLTGDAAAPAAIWMLLGLAASIGAADVLNRMVEMPALRLSRRFKEFAAEGGLSWAALALLRTVRGARPARSKNVEPVAAR